MSSRPQDRAGERVPVGSRVQNRYRILRELGFGAFGTVCLAEDEATAEQVAVRFLPRGVGAVPSARMAEGPGRPIGAGSTSHPGLVRVLEFAEAEPGRLFVVMELVEGRRLSEILSGSKPLDVSIARRWALDLGGSVEALHNMGLVHGALRPRNVVVLSDGRLKLMDVELAGLRDVPTPHGVPAARPPAEYLSPEQIRRAPVTEKTDIYAFGAILYEMFCGAPPFQAPTREAVLAKHLEEEPAPMSRRRAVDAPVERIVRKALDKEPELRPWMDEVLNELWGETSGAATDPVRGGWKRAAAIVSGTAVAAVLIGLVAWAVLGPRPAVVSSVGQSAPSPALERAPVSARPIPSSPAAVTRTESAAKSPTPAVVSPPASGATPPAAESAATLAPAKPGAPAGAPLATANATAAGAASGTVGSTVTSIAEPRPRKKTYRVGWLDSGRAPAPYQDIVKQALVGYPRDIAFEYRSADGRTDRLPELASELVRLKVDVVFAVGNQAIQAARQATSTIPIVMVGSDAASARRDGAGGNITGVAYSSTDLARSWLRLLKEVRPTLSRVAVLYDTDSFNRGELTNLQAVAANAGVGIQPHVVQGGDALGSLFAGSSADRAEAIIVPGRPLNLIHLSRIVDLAGRARVPTVYGSSEFVDAGGLLAYGPSTPAMYRRAGAYIGKILGPTDPRDLPVEQPSRFELVINLKTARGLGLLLPQSLVLRADRVLQ